MKKLSIVVATYNRAPYLLRTLESLARQTLSPGLFEILVVNNNSSDNTPEVVAGFAGSHPQLQVRMVTETFSTPGTDLAAAMNWLRSAGTRLAAG